AEEDWHRDAIREAYSTGDPDWVLTAVFAMRYIDGFDDQIVDALKSHDPLIHAEAVRAAGAHQVDAAWPYVLPLLDPKTPRILLLDAIGAAGSIRPAEAADVLSALAQSDEEDIQEAVEEALLMARGAMGAFDEEEDFDDEDDEEEEPTAH